MTDSLKLIIKKNFHINGLKEYLGFLNSTKEVIVFNKFKTIILSNFPHLFLTNNDMYYGEVFTLSKNVYISKEAIETTPLNLTEKNQRIIFSLSRPEEIIDEPYHEVLKNMGIDTPEKYVALIIKSNLLY
jgi:hypothetical protein